VHVVSGDALRRDDAFRVIREGIARLGALLEEQGERYRSLQGS